MKPVKHNPLFNTDKVCKHYEKVDGVPIIYVCTTELPSISNIPVDVFYRSTPHPVHGNYYFGLYNHPYMNHIMITDADEVETMSIACVDDAGALYYSRYRHDFVETPNGFYIDGGRSYIRSNAHSNLVLARVRDGSVMSGLQSTPDSV